MFAISSLIFRFFPSVSNFITSPNYTGYHASFAFSAVFTTSHLILISSFHNVSDQLFFISSYYMSIPSQPCFPHLLCNVYRLILTSSFYNVSERLSFVSSYVLIPSQPCFPHLFCDGYHSHLILISSFYNISERLPFISSYCMSIPSQPCFPHLFCDAYHSTSYSDLFILQYL